MLVAKPKFFRDPLHQQIRFPPVDRAKVPADLVDGEALGWLLPRLIDTQTFQRLRIIRQNGLANFVFHGMEHSRFAHSMGVSHLAREMVARISRNMGYGDDHELMLEVGVAGLLHDIGHGPFSHTFEDVLGDLGTNFKHEKMTVRLLLEEGTDVNTVLKSYSNDLPERIEPYFDIKKRPADHWKYKIVSSQMDADRLDYVQRDAKFAGISGHGFDIERLLDLISIHDHKCIAVDRGAIEAVEAYLLTIDQLYRSIYYHKAVRSASQMISRAIQRAVFLYRGGDETVFPSINGAPHPIVELIDRGSEVSTATYGRLTDATMWALVDTWRDHKDSVLCVLASMLTRRELFKAIEIGESNYGRTAALVERAKAATKELFPNVPDAEEYFVTVDDPSRVSYKGYDWGNEAADESVWLTGGGKKELPLEAKGESAIVDALRGRMYLPRLIVPSVVREKLTKR